MNHFVFIFIFLLGFAAHAEQGVSVEIGSSVGYVLQTEHTQFKILANYTRSSDAEYLDTAAVRVSLVEDFATTEEGNIYAGLGFWDDFVSRQFSSYENRMDAIVGIRHPLGKHFQVEAFVNGISYMNGGVVTINVDPNNGNRTRQIGSSGWAFARTGAIAISYFF